LSDPAERKKQAIVDDDKARMPITDMTKADEGAGSVIGLGVDTGEARDPPNRSPVATPAPVRPTPKESGARSGSK
jgi:hypothetical protein